MGASRSGACPASKYCMRAFKTNATKNHQGMHPIEDKCITGLCDTPELHFSVSHEPNAHLIVQSLLAFEKFVANYGMDGVFTIVAKDLSKINFLQQLGMVGQTNINDWCDNVVDKGV
jgi:hypothetical protein